MCRIFGVVGVPTIIIVHPEGNHSSLFTVMSVNQVALSRCWLTDFVAWKGRYCAFDFDQFQHFLDYVFAQSLQKPVLPDPDPWEVDSPETTG